MKKPIRRNIPKPTLFGSNLRYLRKLHGYSQAKLGLKVGLKRNNIASYETGLIEPRAQKFLDICTFFKVDPDSMLDLDFAQKSVFTTENTEQVDDLHFLAIDQIEKLSEKTHEMSKILEGYQAFKEIHQGNRNPSEEINHLMIDTIRLFENLIETNWELVSELIVLQGNSFDSEE